MENNTKLSVSFLIFIFIVMMVLMMCIMFALMFRYNRVASASPTLRTMYIACPEYDCAVLHPQNTVLNQGVYLPNNVDVCSDFGIAFEEELV